MRIVQVMMESAELLERCYGFDVAAKTSKLYDFGAAALAFVLWGSWAYVVNVPASPMTGLISGLTQGTSSALMTLVMIKAVTAISRRLQRPFLRLTLPTVITVGAAAIFLVIAHSIAGTPSIFWTILPGLSGALPFCTFTSYKLLKSERRPDRL